MTQFPFFFQLSDVIHCHNSTCPSASNSAPVVKLSLDGISESRSTNISLDVYSMKFNACHSVYPITIIRPLCKLSVNYYQQFKKVLEHITNNNCELSHVIADNPKHAFIRNSLCHGAKYACEYCFANGISLRDTQEIQDQLKKLEKKKIALTSAKFPEELRKKKLMDINSLESKLTRSTQIVWPNSTSQGEKRTTTAVTRYTFTNNVLGMRISD